MPQHRELKPHGHLIAHQTLHPGRSAIMPTRRRARCTAASYDGDIVTVDGIVTARAGRYLAFLAEYPGWGEWLAWVDADCCEPL